MNKQQYAEHFGRLIKQKIPKQTKLIIEVVD